MIVVQRWFVPIHAPRALTVQKARNLHFDQLVVLNGTRLDQFIFDRIDMRHGIVLAHKGFGASRLSQIITKLNLRVSSACGAPGSTCTMPLVFFISGMAAS